jgi:hypothetical protein
MAVSWRAREIVTTDRTDTIADGVAGRFPFRPFSATCWPSQIKSLWSRNPYLSHRHSAKKGQGGEHRSGHANALSARCPPDTLTRLVDEDSPKCIAL